jgi:hypothetical protein
MMKQYWHDSAWQRANEQYLAMAVAWVRERLERHAGRIESVIEPVGGGAADRREAIEKNRPAKNGKGKSDPESKSEHAPGSELDPPPALLQLGKQFGLIPFEQDIVLLCASLEFDPHIATLCARAQNDPARRYPTFALALDLFDDATLDVLSPDRPLRYWRLLEITQPSGLPLINSVLRADETIANYLFGLNNLDDRLSNLVVSLATPLANDDIAPSQIKAAQSVVRRWEVSLDEQRPDLVPAVVQLLGSDRESKQLVARHVAEELGRELYRLPAEWLPPPSDLETFVRLWEREGKLLPVALVIDVQDADKGTDGIGAALRRIFARCHGFFFLAAHERWSLADRPTILLDIERPTAAEQKELWARLVGSDEPDNPDNVEHLVGQFSFNLTTIKQIAEEARGGSQDASGDGNERTGTSVLWDVARQTVRSAMEGLAQRLETRATWDHLVLPHEPLRQLHQIVTQVRLRSQVYAEWGFEEVSSRGLGISALFSGESGTGKTLAAEVLANELRLDLYRIDLAAVVSKYIGETEKNLRRVFDAAEKGGAILFFDEADALFGKRSEVKDSHDRYANIEIGYLLQRMESYRGLAILATNMKSALDRAFTRRIRFMVTFPLPKAAERKLIWQKLLPSNAHTKRRIGQLDYDYLARFPLPGGTARNAALSAAFLATDQKEPVSMPMVLWAIREELLKQDRPINEAEFQWQEKGEKAEIVA